ncbi:MAG: Sua5 family C-terminal domain-containing protein [Bryobacterales bacterium]
MLRAGRRSLERLREVLGEVAFQQRIEEAGAAPGMLLKHYSPRTRLTLVAGAGERLRALAERRLAAGERVGVLLLDADRSLVAGLDVEAGACWAAWQRKRPRGSLMSCAGWTGSGST